jgi:hypothetical protein
MSSIEGISIYQVIIFIFAILTFYLLTIEVGIYQSSPPTFPFVFLTDLATIKNDNKKNKMRILQGI